jgi:MFS family permease
VVTNVECCSANGLPNTMSTYGVVSGMWTSILSLGMFVGPSVGGILLDNVGFRWGSVFVLVAMLVLVKNFIIINITFVLSI